MLLVTSFVSFSAIASAASLSVLSKRGAEDLPADCARNYTVRLGDTCDKISAELNVSTYQLAYANNGTINAGCDNLAEGEPLCLGITGHDCDNTHVIVSGDGCDTIAEAAGITEATLLLNNPNVNSGCTNIYPDEVLCIADGDVYGSSTTV